MKFGLIGPSYTARSNAAADEECINWYAESIETPGAQTKWNYYGTPGLVVFSALPESPARGGYQINGRCFEVGGTKLVELASDGSQTIRATIANDGKPVSIAATNIQLLIISAGSAYCYTLATNAIVDVTADLVGVPIKAEASDSYFIVIFQDSNKFQVSDVLDGTTWPGITVNEVSVFPENITSVIVSHRELWVCGREHIQPYQDTGTDEIFDVIPGALIEQGAVATFGTSLVDNTVFWVNQDTRGARTCWRASGYTPQRISTHAVETALASYANISELVAYTYQETGHLFWVLYVPGADCTWVYDVSTSLWAKRAAWNESNGTFGPHKSWNHVYAFGKHLVGDWDSGNVYDMSLAYLDDAGGAIRRLRRSPIIVNEMKWVYFKQLVLDFATGLGPQPPFTDGSGNPRPPQCMLRWSDDRGSTWSNEYILNCGFAGQYKTRVVRFRMGRSRYRVYEISVTDPIPWTLVDGYLESA